MALDEQTKRVLDRMAAMNPIGAQPTIEQLRHLERSIARKPASERELLERVRDHFLVAGEHRIPVRIYTPLPADKLREPPPALVFFHGGGHTVGTLDDWDGICCLLARSSGMVLVSVDYRRAPEHKFPAAPEDCYAAVSWVAQHAASFGADGACLAVAGDSAGGNLSAVVCLMARERGGPRIGFQALIYPGTNGRAETASMLRNGEGYLLTRKMADWFTEQYLRSDADRADPHFAPMKASDHSGLPPALIVTAEFDPLLDEGEAYAQKLRDAGVPVKYRFVEGTIHGFMTYYQEIDLGRQVLDEIGGALRAHFQND